ncbi:MAG: VWA domain-containing protein [Candidatus Sulfotelmatobacter sp.]
MRDGLSRVHFFLCLVMSIGFCNLCFGQSTPDVSDGPSNVTYRSTASEVRLVFFATDGNDRPIQDLQKNDFAVVDDGMVIRDYRSFARSAAVRLDVIVLCDSSESVLPHLKEQTADVFQLVSQWPWNPGDSVSVLSFSGIETHLVCAGDCRSSFTANRIAAVPRGGSTPLFDALDTAATLLRQRRQPDVWPVIILFSDGDDTISKSSFHEASEKILASGAQVYAIDVSRPGQESNGTAILRRLANDSGGRCIRISEGAVRIFQDVMEDLHSARVVTYALPRSSSEFHSIRILPTHNLNLQFRCRRGYYHDYGGARSEAP